MCGGTDPELTVLRLKQGLNVFICKSIPGDYFKVFAIFCQTLQTLRAADPQPPSPI